MYKRIFHYKIMYPIKIVNLVRRIDRKQATEKMLKNHSIENYEFIEAVDGSRLVLTERLLAIFKDNDFFNRRGVIGCALSHISLWQRLLVDESTNGYVVFEDDFEFNETMNIKDTLIKDCEEMSKGVMDFLFLGFHPPRGDEMVRLVCPSKTYEKFRGRNFIGGSFGYIISKEGAEKLLQNVNVQGSIRWAIDLFIAKSYFLHSYCRYPHLVLSTYFNETGVKTNTGDESDIQ
jgi:glycosyl transferase family 25